MFTTAEQACFANSTGNYTLLDYKYDMCFLQMIRNFAVPWAIDCFRQSSWIQRQVRTLPIFGRLCNKKKKNTTSPRRYVCFAFNYIIHK